MKRIFSFIMAVALCLCFAISNMYIVDNACASQVLDFTYTDNAPQGKGYINENTAFPYDISLDFGTFHYYMTYEVRNLPYDRTTLGYFVQEDVRSIYPNTYLRELYILGKDGEYHSTNHFYSETVIFSSYNIVGDNNGLKLIITLDVIYEFYRKPVLFTANDFSNYLPVFKFPVFFTDRQVFTGTVIPTQIGYVGWGGWDFVNNSIIDFSFTKNNSLPFPTLTIYPYSKFGFYANNISGIPTNTYSQYGFMNIDGYSIKPSANNLSAKYISLANFYNVGNFVYTNYPRSLITQNSFTYGPNGNSNCFIIDFSQFNLYAETTNILTDGVGSQLLDYQPCNWYDIPCHLGNALIFFMYEFPLTKPITTFIFSLFDILKIPFDFISTLSGMSIFPFVIVIFLLAVLFSLIKK